MRNRPIRSISILSGAFERFRINYDRKRLTSHSIQDALRMYLPPIKNDDPKLNFYSMYKRETLEYDTEYMQKYNDDLNNTMIFVCSLFPLIVMHADPNPRPVCSPPSAPRSSSIHSPSSNLARQSDRSCTSEQFSSTSIDPFPPTRMLAVLRRGAGRPRKSSQAWI